MIVETCNACKFKDTIQTETRSIFDQRSTKQKKQKKKMARKVSQNLDLAFVFLVCLVSEKAIFFFLVG